MDRALFLLACLGILGCLWVFVMWAVMRSNARLFSVEEIRQQRLAYTIGFPLGCFLVSLVFGEGWLYALGTAAACGLGATVVGELQYRLALQQQRRLSEQDARE